MKPSNLTISRSIIEPILMGALLSVAGGLRPVLAQPASEPGAGTASIDGSPSPAAIVNYDYFHGQLAPYGTWMLTGDYGWCWHPDAAIAANPEWRPYYDMGQWVYSENGWFWQSNYGWGDIPFHYGNWVVIPGNGWMWVPGYTWGPAWVFWRESASDGYIGWAHFRPVQSLKTGDGLFMESTTASISILDWAKTTSSSWVATISMTASFG